MNGDATKRLRPRGFWRRDAQVRVLCGVIGGELTAGEAAKRLRCTRVMVNQQTYRLRRDLKVAYAAGKMVPGAVLALLGLASTANSILNEAETNRAKLGRANGGDRT